jgi:hypothetical protein
MTIGKKRNTGTTLIEVMMVVLIVMIAVLGAMGIRYYCVTDAKKADVRINATRIGSMLLENWKGTGGASNYDPTSQFSTSGFGSKFTINASATGLAAPSGFTSLINKYLIQDQANKAYYYATLSYKPATVTEPVTLNATMVWRQKYDTGSITTNDRVISLTTYQD